MGELKLGRHRIRTPAICGAVIGDTIAEMRAAAASSVKQGADLIELRFDGLRERAGWEKLILKDIPTIFTNRPKREGGLFSGNEDKRISYISNAISSGVSCVDIELSTSGKLRSRLVSEARRSGVSVLMSWHDFSKTPSLKKMKSIVNGMMEAGCDLAKVVTFAGSSADAFRVLDLLVQVQDEVSLPVIAFAMGDAGRITRIAAPIFGSPITYANAAKSTAPGQLDVATTRRLLREFISTEGKP